MTYIYIYRERERVIFIYIYMYISRYVVIYMWTKLWTRSVRTGFASIVAVGRMQGGMGGGRKGVKVYKTYFYRIYKDTCRYIHRDR